MEELKGVTGCLQWEGEGWERREENPPQTKHQSDQTALWHIQNPRSDSLLMCDCEGQKRRGRAKCKGDREDGQRKRRTGRGKDWRRGSRKCPENSSKFTQVPFSKAIPPPQMKLPSVKQHSAGQLPGVKVWMSITLSFSTTAPRGCSCK